MFCILVEEDVRETELLPSGVNTAWGKAFSKEEFGLGERVVSLG